MQPILACCRDLRERQFQPGDILLAEGQRSGKLYVLIDGAAEVLKAGFPIDVVSEPGAMFGETAVLLDLPQTATVRVTRPSRAYVVEDATAFLRSHPDLVHAISRLLAHRLHMVASYLADLKAQFSDHHDHLAMVDEVLVSLLHQQDDGFSPGSDRCPDPPPVVPRQA